MKETERRIYEYILKCSAKGTAPTVREICEALDIRSTSTVYKYLGTLAEKGLITKIDHASRSVRPAGQPAVTVPIYDKVSPGLPLLSEENIGGYVSFTPRNPPKGKLFAVINDTSDICIAEIGNTVENGDVAVIFKNKVGKIVNFDKKEHGGYDIIGTVIAVIRYLK